MPNAREKITRWIRQDGFVILLYGLLLVIMTYPLVFVMGQVIPFHNSDTYTAMWQNWWIKEVFANGYDLNYTPLLFYPEGLDLTLLPRRWTSYPLWAIYHLVFGDPTAFNLTVLTQAFIRAYAMFRLILLFVPHRSSAFIGGAFFAFSARILSQGIQQPNTGSLEFIPIFMIFFVLALRQASDNKGIQPLRYVLGLMVLAAITFSANVYMNIKIGIFAMFIGGAYVAWVFYLYRLWRYVRFWVSITIFAVVSLVITAPIIIPAVTSDGLAEAMNYTDDLDEGVDLFGFVKPDLSYPAYPMFHNQVIASFQEQTVAQGRQRGLGQVGFISLALALTGAVYVVRKHREQLIWIVLWIIFFLLSLGTTFMINRIVYPEVWLPYQLLTENALFVALRSPLRFQLLFIFVQAILVSYGVFRLYQRDSTKRYFQWMMIGVTVLMLFETSVFPIPYSTAYQSEAYDYVVEQHQGPIITIPMGRQEAKFAMYNQMDHEQPIVDGKIARTPNSAFDFINQNLFLRDMAQLTELTQITDELHDRWVAEVDELLEFNFRYVVVHRFVDIGRQVFEVSPEQERMFFMQIEPDFETTTEAIYDLRKLRDNPPK